jgi:hypothetical protein
VALEGQVIAEGEGLVQAMLPEQQPLRTSRDREGFIVPMECDDLMDSEQRRQEGTCKNAPSVAMGPI